MSLSKRLLHYCLRIQNVARFQRMLVSTWVLLWNSHNSYLAVSQSDFLCQILLYVQINIDGIKKKRYQIIPAHTLMIQQCARGTDTHWLCFPNTYDAHSWSHITEARIFLCTFHKFLPNLVVFESWRSINCMYHLNLSWMLNICLGKLLH